MLGDLHIAEEMGGVGQKCLIGALNRRGYVRCVGSAFFTSTGDVRATCSSENAKLLCTPCLQILSAGIAHIGTRDVFSSVSVKSVFFGSAFLSGKACV